MVSILTRLFGIHNFSLAEDAVQETFLKAVRSWELGKIPDNRSAWLIQAAKNTAIDVIRRQRHLTLFADDLSAQLHSEWLTAPVVNDIFDDSGIRDSQLRMIFTCCHPVLPAESQLALTLKTLCGFSLAEIAKSLLTTEANIEKRLYRAKQKIRDGQISFAIPSAGELAARACPGSVDSQRAVRRGDSPGSVSS